MKTLMTKPLIALITLVVLTLSFAARAQDDQPSDQDNDTPDNTAANPAREGFTPQNNETNVDNEQLGELIQAAVAAQQAADAQANGTNALPDPRSLRPIRGQGPRGTTGSGTNVISLTALVAKNGTNHNAGDTNTLRLNFRNAPLSLVLDYLSEAAGFTISPNSKVDLKGAVTVWSNRPMNRDEAVALLHKALGEYNYGATVENGNILNIYVVDPSNTEIFAGITNNDYNTIPATKDLVTQIVYVHNVESSQLISSLQPLMPAGTSMSANQGANAIVITDTKANIRRMAQLVKALDTSSVSASEMRVFPLDYADATALAQVVTQLFQSNDSSQNGRNRGGFGGFPGFGGFGGDRGRGGDNNSGGSTQAGRVAAAKVTAVADERSNSLVVSAAAEQMKYIEDLVKQMDVNVDDLTELKVFRLRYADPQETADQLTSLFPDPTAQQNSRGQGFRGFGPFGNFGGGNNNRSSTSATSRTAKQTRVTAVPDPRTSSVIVSASRETMGQIASIVEELDSDPSKKKKVHVIKVENRDPQEVVEELQSIIAQDTSAGTLNNNRNSQTRQTGSQLNSRQQNNLQNQRSNNQGGLGNNNR